ncbi:MAG: hypothetical protein R3F37_05930 [Candidatus Competibacteraceae bacterium]
MRNVSAWKKSASPVAQPNVAKSFWALQKAALKDISNTTGQAIKHWRYRSWCR